MQKTIIFIIYLIFIITYQSFPGKQGQEVKDSLKVALLSAREDTNKVNLLCKLSQEYYNFNTDIGISYGQQALLLSEKLNWKPGRAFAMNCLGNNNVIKGNATKALEFYSKALEIFTELVPYPSNLDIFWQNIIKYYIHLIVV